MRVAEKEMHKLRTATGRAEKTNRDYNRSARTSADATSQFSRVMHTAISGCWRMAAQVLTDPRRKASCRHALRTMVRRRVYALALGYEGLNDHDELRSHPALQTAVGADQT